MMEIDELNETEPDNEEDLLWSIEDDTLFQPCGLISHSSSSNNKTKSVFVTWNEYYLINYRFKKSKKTNRMEMTKVRIPLPNNSHLRSIHMLEYNTLLLMSDGRVHCFGSIKSLHSISWLKGVRAFARSQEGFTVILHNEETQKLLLQVYMDLPSLGKGESTLQQSYDITYDEQNIFHCDWVNDHYTIMTVTVAQPHEKFMQCLFGVGAVTDKQLHIFSVAGHVFVLIPHDAAADAGEESESEQAYDIELLCVYTTSVSFMRLLPAQNLCLVYLSCGGVDIWYMSQLLGIKQRQMHYTGAEWLDYDASSDNGDFYYTDGEELVRLRFQYDVQLDDCVVQRCIKPVAGMQACTWVQHIEQLVCLSDNNIFYRIAFSLDEVAAAEDGGVLNDVTPATIERLRGNAQILKQYEEQPAQLLAAIQREHEKQQLVAVARNEAWHENGLEATLEFRQQLPVYGTEMLLLYTARQVELDSSGIYAVLQLKLHNSHLLLHSSHWQVLVYHGHHAHVHRVPTDLLLSRKCIIIIPLKKVVHERLPDFTLKLVAFLELKSQINAVLLPVEVQETSETYRALFSGQLYSLNLYNKPQPADMLTKTSGKAVKPIIQQKIVHPNNLNLKEIATLGKVSEKIHDKCLELFFLDSKLNLTTIEEENKTLITIQSEDASALYHFKQHLHLNIDPDCAELAAAEVSQLKIMKLQHDIERFYGFQNAEEFEENAQIHLESLILKYNMLRNTSF